MSFLTPGGAPAAPPPPPNVAASTAGTDAARSAAALANGKGFGNTIKTGQQGAAAPKTASTNLFGT